MIQRRWEPEPTDGYAYNAIELSAIWELEVDITKMIETHAKAWEFQEHVIGLYNDPQDIARHELLRRALLAEAHNPPQPEPPAWPCVTELCPNDRSILTFDHDEPNGWVHGDPTDAEC